MYASDHPLSKEEFDYLYSKVPRLTVEVIIKNDTGEIYLAKRSIEPCNGQWNLPGGTVRFAEPLADAVRRIARRELGVEATDIVQKGIIEYPSHYLNDMDDPVGIVYEVLAYSGEPTLDVESETGGWFGTSLPSPMHADQDTYLIKAGYIKSPE